MYIPFVYMLILLEQSLFQDFVAPIDQTRLPLMAHLTMCQINTMRLILISPIHNQCWKHSCPSCRSRLIMNTCHYLSPSTVFQTLPVFSCQTCIEGLCAPVVTHSIWNTIDFWEEMSRYVHCTYTWYMLCI